MTLEKLLFQNYNILNLIVRRKLSVYGHRTLSSPFRSFGDGTSGFLVPQWDRNSMKIDGQTTNFASQLIGWKFTASVSNEGADVSIPKGGNDPVNISGGDDDIDCPNPQTPKNGASITSTQALSHYFGGSGKELSMSIKEINANVPSLTAFSIIQDKIKKGTKKPLEQISISRATSPPVATSGDQAAFLGRITFNVTGTLNLYLTGDYQFYGTIGVNKDTYDFDGDNATRNKRRTSIGQLSTNIGSLISGKSFDININGRFSLDIEGNADRVSSYKCR